MDPQDQQRLVRALEFALRAHANQKRKGSGIPYSSHLLQVAGLVQEHGGDVEQAVAALLHDAIEDCADVSYESILDEFGSGVADIVRDCTDTAPGEQPGKKRPWTQRKTAYLAHLRTAPERSVLVSVCDKRHNLGTTVADVRARGIAYFDHFNASGAQQIWYYASVLEATRGRVPTRLHEELAQLLAELRVLVGDDPA